MSFIPNTTPTPNWLYNGEMKKMSDTELRVVLIITRHTLGWIENKETGMRKQEDWISHTKLINISGKSSPAISKAVNNCVEHGWIETRDKNGNLLLTSNERRRRRVFYRLGNIFIDKLKSTKVSKVDENLPNLTTKSTKVSKVNLPNLVRNTKETNKETIQKENSFLFSLFKEKINKRAQLTPQAIAKFKARRKQFSVKGIEKAIINFSQNDWKMENLAHKSFTWFLEKDSRIEDYINLSVNKN